MNKSELRFRSFDFTLLALFRIGLGFSYPFFSNQIIYPVCSWLGLLFSIALVIGWRPRWSAFFCLLCTLGAFADPMTVYAGDRVYRILLLMAVFLPTGNRFSIDRKKSNQPVHPWIILIYTIQISAIYFFAALGKLMSPEWRNGVGAYYALSSSYATSIGTVIAQNRSLAVLANHLTLVVEVIAPILLLVSMRNFAKLRFAGLAMLAAFHLMVAVTFQLFGFQLISLISLLPLIPLESRASARPWPKAWLNPIAGLYVILMILLNLQSLAGDHGILSRIQNTLYQTAGIRQGWMMFSWSMSEDSTLRAFVVLKKGDRVEWNDEGELQSFFFGEHARQRRSKLVGSDHETERRQYATQICQAWKAIHRAQDLAQEIEFEWVRLPILPEGGKDAPIVERFTGYRCFD